MNYRIVISISSPPSPFSLLPAALTPGPSFKGRGETLLSNCSTTRFPRRRTATIFLPRRDGGNGRSAGRSEWIGAATSDALRRGCGSRPPPRYSGTWFRLRGVRAWGLLRSAGLSSAEVSTFTMMRLAAQPVQATNRPLLRHLSSPLKKGTGTSSLRYSAGFQVAGSEPVPFFNGRLGQGIF